MVDASQTLVSEASPSRFPDKVTDGLCRHVSHTLAKLDRGMSFTFLQLRLICNNVDLECL